jgi:hypothetical protein
MNDGVEQQTQRVYQNVALLALDLLARIIAMRIDAGPPCMGPFLSSGFKATHLSFLIAFCSPADRSWRLINRKSKNQTEAENDG